MFKLGIISDEISPDFEEACRYISEWGLTHVELRTMWGQNVMQLSEPQLDELGQIIDKYQLTVSAIASPVFKSPRSGEAVDVAGDFQVEGYETFEAQLDLIRQAAVLCKRFGTDKIRVFTFWREAWTDEVVDDIADKMIEATRLAKALNVVLAVENEPVCMVGNGAEMARLFEAIHKKLTPDLKPHIGILWDPGNASDGGREVPFPDGYNAIKVYDIVHVHLKDGILDEDGNRTRVPMGQGVVNYIGQLQQLEKDAYKGVLILEPHYRPEGKSIREAAYACVQAAKEHLHAAFV